MKVLAVGDIHTKTWIIDKVEELVADYDAVVFCGDYADNWNTSPGETMAAWRILKMLMDSNENVYAVIGNHDYAYLHKEIAGRSSGWNPVTYQLLNAPENKKLRSWLLSLPPFLKIEGVTYSHAGLTEEWDGETDVQGLWNDYSPIWVRPAEFGGRAIYRRGPQVIGHNASEKIWNPAENVWCIDTFSEHQDNTPIGDQTVLEVINGQTFNIKSLENDYNSNTSGFENTVS